MLLGLSDLQPDQIGAWSLAIALVVGSFGSTIIGIIVAIRTGKIQDNIATTVKPLGEMVEHISDQVTTGHSLTIAEILEQTRSEQIARKEDAGIPLTQADKEHLASMERAGRDAPNAPNAPNERDEPDEPDEPDEESV